MKKSKGRSLDYNEPANSKSNLRWVVGGKEEGGEKEYHIVKGKIGIVCIV